MNTDVSVFTEQNEAHFKGKLPIFSRGSAEQSDSHFPLSGKPNQIPYER